MYEAGLLVKEGATSAYTVEFDGYYYYVVFAVAPTLSDDICVMATRV